MPRRFEDLSGIVDLYEFVGWRVQDQQGSAQVPDPVLLRLGGDVVEEFAPDAERPAAKEHLGGTGCLDLLDCHRHQLHDVRRVGRRGQCNHSPRTGYPVRRGQYRGAAERVPDEQGGCLVIGPQVLGSANQVVHVGGEARRGEIALGIPQPGEIEAQHRNT